MADRPTAHSRGYSRRWQRARLAYLDQHPHCVRCAEVGRHVLAAVVDHIRPHGGDAALFWEQDNWQSLCKPCHDRKTAMQDGGLGHARRERIAPRGCDADGRPLDGAHWWNDGEKSLGAKARDRPPLVKNT